MSIHKTVLLHETIQGLNLDQKSTLGTVVVDATFGGGGHSALICEKYPGVHIVALDQDKAVGENVVAGCPVHFYNMNFRNLDHALARERLEAVDGVVFDFGLSSDQLENSGRGFSFMKDEPLLMTLKENPSSEDITAYDIVNTWEEKNLADIIYGYGEEKLSRKIAKAIVDARQKREIKTTRDLVNIIEASVGAAYKRSKIHCATKTFQALRMAVNDELGAIEEGLQKGFHALKVGGRMSVISFHSLEDRIVKRYFKTLVQEGLAQSIHKKPITPTREELLENKRARSAKLRVIEKIK